MKLKVFGIEFDQPNLNGRVYLRDDVEKALQAKTQFVVTHNTSTSKVIIDEICGFADPIIEPDGLWVTVRMLNTPRANEMTTILENAPDTLCVTPVGVGFVENGVVRDFELSHFTFSDASKCK